MPGARHLLRPGRQRGGARVQHGLGEAGGRALHLLGLVQPGRGDGKVAQPLAPRTPRMSSPSASLCCPSCCSSASTCTLHCAAGWPAPSTGTTTSAVIAASREAGGVRTELDPLHLIPQAWDLRLHTRAAPALASLSSSHIGLALPHSPSANRDCLTSHPAARCAGSDPSCLLLESSVSLGLKCGLRCQEAELWRVLGWGAGWVDAWAPALGRGHRQVFLDRPASSHLWLLHTS